MCRTFGCADLNALCRTLTRAQFYLLMHGDLLLQRRAGASARDARAPAEPPTRDTRKMTKAEYMEFINEQMAGKVTWQ